MGQRSGLWVTSQGCGSQVRVEAYRSGLWVRGQGCGKAVFNESHVTTGD